VFGGPAHVSVSQDVVTRVNYTETYPYDSATYQGVDLDHEEASKWGVSGGLDLAYFFSRSFGAGAGFRYGGGNVEFTSMSGAGLESSIGGFDITAGFRIRF
jgi:hypothetical protein